MYGILWVHVHIMIREGVCLGGARGQGWVDTCCEMVCKNCACLSFRRVHRGSTTLASISG